MSKMGRLFLELQEHGFNNLEEAEAGGYEMIDGKLYMTADKALQDEKDEQLDRLDGVIDYLKGEEDDVAQFMIRELEEVERYIKERS